MRRSKPHCSIISRVPQKEVNEHQVALSRTSIMHVKLTAGSTPEIPAFAELVFLSSFVKTLGLLGDT